MVEKPNADHEFIRTGNMPGAGYLINGRYGAGAKEEGLKLQKKDK